MTTKRLTRVAERYEVLRELGRGAMGVVYLAHDTKFGADVALKVAPPLLAHDEFRARFVREARIGFRLGRQEGFVRALDWGELPGGDLYLAADLVEDAVPLDLRAGLRPVSERVAMFCRAATLLGRAHAHGIVHRDVKPENFLLSGKDDLYLTDFGLAKVLHESDAEAEILGYSLRTGRDSYVGTPQFMAPEQFEDPALVDARADIYSLGVMLYHALTGQYPYPRARAGVQLICKHLAVRNGDEPAPRPRNVEPEIDEVLDQVCASMLAIDPAQRPASIEALLLAISASREVQARSATDALVAAMRKPEGARTHGSSGAAPFASASSDLVPTFLSGVIDAGGLTTSQALRELKRRLGPEAFRTLLAGDAAVHVADERELQDRESYLGRFGLLRRRPGVPGEPDQVGLGRSRAQADIAFALPTISTVQLRFLREGHRWYVVETGSLNGTELNGARLAHGEARALANGDVLYLSKHLTLVFHDTGTLEHHLHS